LELKLEGTASNRDGIGARIKVTAGGRVQYNHVSFAAGYASSSAAPIHFGLGPGGFRQPDRDSLTLRYLAGTQRCLG
jgi:hypothetical protein